MDESDSDMNSKPQREEALFQAAAQLAGAERAAFLDSACRGDAALRQRLEALLAAHNVKDSFLESEEPKPGGEAVPTMKLELADTPDEAVGQKLGPYKLREKIGEGGCGVVYVADQEHPVRRRVALKVIKLGMDTKQVVARFEAERQALAMMDHPNIAKVLDAGTTETGRPYFIMELVRGIKITDYCDQEKVPTRERLELFIQICHAIQHAHQKGIIHRDIKPSNILVTLHDGVPVPKVIDFGIAKATEGRLTDSTVYTQLHQFIGTPAYMSPEQAEMSGLDVDTRSDIYSLGVLLYELLTGKTPFDANELMSQGIDEMRKTIREKEPPRPSTKLHTLQGEELTTTAKRHGVDAPKLASQLRGDLDWIVMKCLEKDRKRRYETANGLAMDLKRHLNNETVVARPPSKLYEFQKTVRRHKVGFAATAAVIVVLAAGIVMTTWQAVRATHAKQEAFAARQEAETNEQKAIAAQATETKLREQAQADEKKAQTEAARSAAVAQFMKDMLNGVGPSVALGRDTTLLREILDQTAQRLNALNGQPEVEADLRMTLGVVYYNISDYDKSKAMLQGALVIQKKLHGDKSLPVAAALYQLGQLYHRAAMPAEAEADYRQALAIQEELLGQTNLVVASTLDDLGSLLRNDGQDAEAEANLRESLAIRRKLLPTDHPDIATSLSALGLVLADEGKLKEAELCHRESLAMRQRLLPPDHPKIANSEEQLAGTLVKEGEYAEAETNYLAALAIDRKVLGDSRDTANALEQLASLLVKENRLPEAEPWSREAVAMATKIFGAHSRTVAQWQVRLAAALRSEGKFAEADALIREAAKSLDPQALYAAAWNLLNLPDPDFGDLSNAVFLAEKAVALTSRTNGHYLATLVTAYGRIGQVDKAVVAEKESLALLPRDNPIAFNQIAWILATAPYPNMRDGSNAVVFAEKAVDETGHTTANILDTLAAAYAEAGQFAKAVATEKEAVALSSTANSKQVFAQRVSLYESSIPYRDHSALAVSVSTLLQAGKFAEAEPMARDCLRLREKLFPDSWYRFNAESLLGGSLLGQKKYAEAGPLLLSGYTGLKQREDQIAAADRQPRLKEALERLVQFYQATGQTAKAAALQPQLDELNPPASK
jgi:eukaryotic-like serine/threonine-protein kinase